MKSVRHVTMLVVGVALLFVMSAMTVAAAPDGDISTTDNPATAARIDGAAHDLKGDSVQWYMFNYNGTRSDDGTRNNATVAINNLTQDGLGFEVYTPEQIANWWENNPIGRGSRTNVLCSPIDTDWNYTCQTYSLLWTGKFPNSGMYYVRVTNDGPNTINYTLTENE